ncbi:MAG: DUF4174 domain-containing protein [Phycisphaeraceae bacterium]
MQDDQAPGLDANLDRLRANHRLLLLFAPYRDNGPLQWQQQTLAASQGALNQRHVKLLTIIGHDEGYLDGQPLNHDTIIRLREEMEADAGKFTLILLDRDGQQMLYSHKPVRLHDLFAQLDALPKVHPAER